MLSGCIRNVHYLLESGNFVQSVEKNRTERDILFRFLVEVTGFEPATFWSRTKRATKLRYTSVRGANEGTRTLDLRFTKPLLCQLSYIGAFLTAANNFKLYHIGG